VKARVRRSEYMEWAKTQSQAPFNLASSGVAELPAAELRAGSDLDMTAQSLYGHAPLQERLAARCGVAPEQVVAAIGTSLANHLVLGALLDPGDEVLIEQPTYGPVVDTALYLGADVRRFPRHFEGGFCLDPREVERALTPRTRAIVLTNLHNPSSAFVDEGTLAEIGALARSVGARVVVDEVYLESLFEARPPSSVRLGPEFVATRSLTKAFGLGGLRCGWILAEPELARRLWRLNDLFGVTAAAPAERLSVVALDQIERLAARARGILETNRAAFNAFLRSRTDLECGALDVGMTAFPRLVRGDVESLCSLLRERYATTVVPGRFFDMPHHFRISIGGRPEVVAGGLQHLAGALDQIAAPS